MYDFRVSAVWFAPVMCGVRLQNTATEPAFTGTQTASWVAGKLVSVCKAIPG
jgi:hypothetical protein